jgi:hypothetical protein
MSSPDPLIPSRTTGDFAHALAKAGLSSVPVVGGAAVEFFQLLIQPPIEKRRDAWMAAIGERLHALEKNGLDLTVLQQNEQFLTATMKATQIALRSHSAEKLASLRNAIVAVALGAEPDETLQHVFLALIDELSEMHIRILALLNEPKLPSTAASFTVPEIVEAAIPSLREQSPLYYQLVLDLYTRGLLRTRLHPHDHLSREEASRSRTTELGRTFLHFIAEQPEP